MQKWLNKLSTEITQKSHRCFLFSDPTRLKILLMLKQTKKVCVSDLAQILGVTISAISHQLSKLEKMGLVKGCKKGKIVCYCLNKENKGRVLKCLRDI